MGKPISVIAQEEHWNKEECKRIIFRRGCYGLAEEKGRYLEAVINYAKDELGMENPPLFGKYDHLPTKDIIRKFIFETHAVFEENKRLKNELRLRNELDEKLDNLARDQLIELYEAVHGDNSID